MKNQFIKLIDKIHIIEKNKLKIFSNSKDLKLINLNLKKFDTTQDNWIKKSIEKKYLFNFFYNNKIFLHKKILDVGSGSALIRKFLIKKNQLDIKSIDFEINFKNNKKNKIIDFDNDFFSLKKKGMLEKHYDAIFANDIFPNVDNRLEEFILTAKTLSPNLILSITIHPYNKFYYCKIIKSGEIITYAPMNKEKILFILKKFKNNVVNKSIFKFLNNKIKIKKRLYLLVYLNF